MGGCSKYDEQHCSKVACSSDKQVPMCIQHLQDLLNNMEFHGNEESAIVGYKFAITDVKNLLHARIKRLKKEKLYGDEIRIGELERLLGLNQMPDSDGR